jgi:hypothetical protein
MSSAILIQQVSDRFLARYLKGEGNGRAAATDR